MDSSTLTSIIIAVVAIIPGVWALINQANKDKKEADLNQAKMTADQIATNQQTAMALLTPLREENARLLARIAELEADKEKISDESFQKDSIIQNLTLSNQEMKMRMGETPTSVTPPRRRTKKPAVPPEGETK